MTEKNGREKKERRQEIIEAAAELFAEKGYEATTVSEIVQKAGIAQGTFYLYFPTKEHVRLALHEQIINEIIDEAMAVFDREDDVIKKIEYGIKIAFAVMKRHEKLILVAHLATSAKECEAADREMNKKLAVHLAELLKEGTAKGIFKKLDPEVTAFLIIGMIEKVAISALLWQEPDKLEHLIPMVIDFTNNAIIK